MNTALDQALTRLPHGPGFRFVDKLTELEPGKRALGLFLVKEDAHLKDHFPGNPIMPAVLLVEAIAQLAGIAAQESGPEDNALADLRLAAINQSKILGAARPGDQLLIEAVIKGRLGNLIQAEGHVTLTGNDQEEVLPLARAQITLSVDA